MKRIQYGQLLILFFIACIIILPLTACDEEEVTRAYTRVETFQVNGITVNGATFLAEIIEGSDKEIDQIGFVWGKTSSLQVELSEFIFINKQDINGKKFSFDVRSTLEENVTYYVRAFARQGELTVYGQIQSFNSLGSEGPAVDYIEPSSGTLGDTVLIYGQSFSNRDGSNQVKLGDIIIPPFFSSDSLLKVVIPQSYNQDISQLTVSIVGNNSSDDIDFTLTSPVISGFTPEAATDLNEVTITGNNFAWNKTFNIVKFNDQVATVLEANKNELVVQVPAGITTAMPVVTVTVAGKVGTSNNIYSMLPPVITDFTPKSGICGEVITIEGENFGTLTLSNKVYLGGLEVFPVSTSANNIQIVIPGNIPPTSAIEVKTAEQTDITDILFESLGDGPNVTIIDSDKSVVTNGDQLILNGTNFSSTNNKVTFNGITSQIVSQSTSSISVTVPNGITNSMVEILVESTNGQCSGISDPFEIEYVGGIWTEEGTQFPTNARAGGFGFKLGNELFYGLGTYAGNFYNDFWKYDVIADAWTRLTDFPGGFRHGAVYFSIGNKGYVGLGISNSNSHYNDLWEYEPTSDSWTQVANFMGSPRRYSTYFVHDNNAYVGLGEDFSQAFSDIYKFNPQDNSWTFVTNFPGTARASLGTFKIGDSVYMGFGQSPEPIRTRYSDFWKYDIATSTWEEMPSLPDKVRAAPIAFEINNKGYLGMGVDQNGNLLRDVWQFNPSGNTWQKTSFNKFGGGFHDYQPLIIDGRAYLLFISRSGGGINYTRKFQIFDPIE